MIPRRGEPLDGDRRASTLGGCAYILEGGKVQRPLAMRVDHACASARKQKTEETMKSNRDFETPTNPHSLQVHFFSYTGKCVKDYEEQPVLAKEYKGRLNIKQR